MFEEEEEVKLTNREKKLEARNRLIKKHGRNIGVIYMNASLKRAKGGMNNAS